MSIDRDADPVETREWLDSLDGVLVRAGGELVAVPADGVERLVRVRPEGLATVAGRTTVEVGGERLPYCVLARVLGSSRGQLPPAKKALPALVLVHGPTRIVAAVDEVLGQEELVLEPLGDAVASLPHLAGAAVREGRKLVPVLAVPELVRTARPPSIRPLRHPPASAGQTRRHGVVPSRSHMSRQGGAGQAGSASGGSTCSGAVVTTALQYMKPCARLRTGPARLRAPSPASSAASISERNGASPLAVPGGTNSA